MKNIWLRVASIFFFVALGFFIWGSIHEETEEPPVKELAEVPVAPRKNYVDIYHGSDTVGQQWKVIAVIDSVNTEEIQLFTRADGEAIIKLESSADGLRYYIMGEEYIYGGKTMFNVSLTGPDYWYFKVYAKSNVRTAIELRMMALENH